MINQGSWFGRFAQEASRLTGRPLAFVAALSIVLVWAAMGPVFGYSDTWQLVINTGTTIITFLMVFVIQNTQNRDTVAMQIKLDELIRVSRSARNVLLDLEELDDKDLEALRQDYERLAEEYRAGGGSRSPREAARPGRSKRSGKGKRG
ncbi:MAG: low affinity iron permease family protein [Methyloceanibacter sp.]|uniref:low affinity iron permease family protein n=1 Tax=Methyloceanibacter sp. TaxID=1965321 RepID=UPI003D6D742F